jgi:hypothetical protein
MSRSSSEAPAITAHVIAAANYRHLYDWCVVVRGFGVFGRSIRRDQMPGGE